MQKLIRIAGDVQGNFDYDFALEMMDRFELNGKKKYKQLSLGMKTMVSTIICLGSNNSVILLDEPVLGFDAIMRMEFYNLLSESYRRHPRIILISTHIIEEIADTVQYLIILDKGSIRFFDSLETVGSKAFSISGLKGKVEKVSASLNVIAKDELKAVIRDLLHKYHAEYALLCGSYARGEATADSDIDALCLAGRTSALRIFSLLVRSCIS